MGTRRQFLRFTSLLGMSSCFLRQPWAQSQVATATIQYRSEPLAVMPADFTGLSYESVQLYDPKFFSAENTKLVTLCRELTPSGVLRLGGNLSDLSRWRSDTGDFDTPKQAAAIEKGKQYWEWKLTSTTARADRAGAITPEAIRNLAAFLDATNWRLLYGLNYGSGTVERAADEAACVAREVGSRLVAFQIGNESDSFGGNPLFRTRPFSFAQYWEEYQSFTGAVRQRVPRARFAGPDVASNMRWVQQFAEEQAAEPGAHKAVLLTGHYYAMGPAKDPAMNAERLLSPNPKLEQQIQSVTQARAASKGLPYRMAEGNSCFGGGKPGVSDAFCSALWGADYMLHLAAAGYSGVNLHGGGDGHYTPIESLDTVTATPRPLYFGMQLAQLFAGHAFVTSELQTDENMTAYAARDQNVLQIALFNKGGNAVTVKGLPDKKPKLTWTLTAPDLASASGVSLRQIETKRRGLIVLPPYSARVDRWEI